MKFNINHNVKVKLTDLGRKVHSQWWDNLACSLRVPYQPPKEDAEGYSIWSLWHLMKVFGEHIHLWCQPPFETEIEILEE